MRTIKEIIVHCSATTVESDWKLADVERCHKLRKFPMYGGTYCGYHYVVDLDGRIEIGKELKYTGCHCRGHNAQSIGICCIGGMVRKDGKTVPGKTLTDQQTLALFNLVAFLRACFPDAKVYGHCDFARRDCPCFEVRDIFPPEWCGVKT